MRRDRIKTAYSYKELLHQKRFKKKGLSKFLCLNIGGEAFEQSVKQTIKGSVGVMFQLLVI